MPQQAVDEGFNATPGLGRAIVTKGTHRTCACGFPVPKYPGRYPKNCPSCGAALDGSGAQGEPLPVPAVPSETKD